MAKASIILATTTLSMKAATKTTFDRDREYSNWRTEPKSKQILSRERSKAKSKQRMLTVPSISVGWLTVRGPATENSQEKKKNTKGSG